MLNGQVSPPSSGDNDVLYIALPGAHVVGEYNDNDNRCHDDITMLLARDESTKHSREIAVKNIKSPPPSPRCSDSQNIVPLPVRNPPVNHRCEVGGRGADVPFSLNPIPQ